MCWPMLTTSKIPSVTKGEDKTKLNASDANYNTECYSLLSSLQIISKNTNKSLLPEESI